MFSNVSNFSLQQFSLRVDSPVRSIRIPCCSSFIMMHRPGPHAGLGVPRADQPRSCSLCRDEMASSDFHGACIVCLGVKHAFDAVYSPGGPAACPACALFSPERLKVRLENAQRWCSTPATDAHSDPLPSWLRRQNIQTAGAPAVSPGPGAAAGPGAPGAIPTV